MTVLGENNGTSYPVDIDTTSLETVSTTVRIGVPNDLYRAVVAIEGELGKEPKGTATDVKTFLQNEHNTDGTHDSSTVAMLAGTQTFTGAKTFSSTITVSTLNVTNIAPSGTLTVTGASTLNSTLDVAGNVTMDGDVTINGTLKNWPAFVARRVTTDQTPSGLTVVVFNQEQNDTDTMYDVTTGVFSPTVAGYYMLTTSVKVLSPSTDQFDKIYIYQNSAAVAGNSYSSGDGESFAILACSVVVYNDGNDTFDVRVDFQANKDIANDVVTRFSGCRIR